MRRHPPAWHVSHNSHTSTRRYRKRTRIWPVLLVIALIIIPLWLFWVYPVLGPGSPVLQKDPVATISSWVETFDESMEFMDETMAQAKEAQQNLTELLEKYSKN